MKTLNLKDIKNNLIVIILSIIAINLTILSFKYKPVTIVTANFSKIDNSLLTFSVNEKDIVKKTITRKLTFKDYLSQLTKQNNLVILDNRYVNVASKEDITSQLLILVDDIKNNEKS